MTARKDAIWCVIPAKGFARAKSRLSDVVSDEQRADLAREMFGHVHSVCAAHPRVVGVLVATDDAGVETVAKGLGAEIIRDAGTTTLGEVVDAALMHAADLGATHGVVVMSDLPRFSAQDIDALIDGLSTRRIVIAPDRSQAGTNALALDCPAPMRTCFGRIDSFQAHQQAAKPAGLDVEIVTREGIALDVDTPDDYALWRSRSTRT